MTSRRDCDLCGLPMIGAPVRADDHQFCCEGCRRVWSAAEASGIEGLLGSARDQRARARAASERRAALARASGAQRETLSVEGMWCASCATVLEDAVLSVPGALDAEVSYAASLARVTYDPSVTDIPTIQAQIGRIGYAAQPARLAENPDDGVEDTFLRFFVGSAVGMWIMWPALFMLYPAFVRGEYASVRIWNMFVGAEALVVLLYCGWPFLTGAIRAARVGRATMDTLVVLGTWTGFIYSVWTTISGTGPTYFDSAAMITTIVLAGRWLEALGRRDAARSIEALARTESAPEAWLLEEDGSLESARRVQAGELQSGDFVAVRAGERVPVDGVVVEGESDLDVSRLTGEPVPAGVSVGSEVWSGAINLTGILVVRTSRVGDDTMSGRLALIAEDAVFARSHLQRLADKIANVFVPTVLSIAAVTLVTTWLAIGLPEAVGRAVAVLVVACPCALGLATPLASVNAIAAGARRGLMVRGGPVLERAGRIAIVAFDKTGTVTMGRLAIASIDAADGITDDDLLRTAAALELGESHPVAGAVLAAAAERGLETRAATDCLVHAGLGVTGAVAGRAALIGNEALIAEQGIAIPGSLRDAASRRQGCGEVVVWVAFDQGLLGMISLADEVRSEAPELFERLRSLGVTTAIISGDAQQTTDSISKQLGVDRSYGGVLPHDKERIVRELAGSLSDASGRRASIAFVGDGVNDAAALAASDIAIAVGGSSEVAQLAADVIALDPAQPLAGVVPLVRLSAASRRVIAQNLTWAFSYNLVTIPLAVTGVLDPIAAAIAMALSSLAVVANSLRLRYAAR